MTDEMKLLRAFIEASGYKVEKSTTSSLDGLPFSGDNPYHLIDANRINDVVMDTEYKVTKRQGSTQDRISEARMIEQYQALSGRKL